MVKVSIGDFAASHQIDGALLAEAMEADQSDEYEAAELASMREYLDACAVEAVVDARDYLSDARRTLTAAEKGLRLAVGDALKDGLPATRVAQILGVSRARVYQIRDGKR